MKIAAKEYDSSAFTNKVPSEEMLTDVKRVLLITSATASQFGSCTVTVFLETHRERIRRAHIPASVRYPAGIISWRHQEIVTTECRKRVQHPRAHEQQRENED